MAGPYGKPLFFSKLQMIPVKDSADAPIYGAKGEQEKPPEGLEQKPESGSRELEAGSHKRKTK